MGNEPSLRAGLEHDQLESATARLLIELAFLVPRGTDLAAHPISEKLKAFARATRECAVADLLRAQPPEINLCSACASWRAQPPPAPDPPKEDFVPALPPTMANAAEMLWIVLANVNEGDWSKQSADWQHYAARWRDYYFDAVRLAAPPAVEGTRKPKEEPCLCGDCCGDGFDMFPHKKEKP